MFQFWYDFIQSLLKKDDSAQLAAGRLKGSVFLDRLSLSPGTLDQIRTDVVRTISRYVVIDESAMTLAVQAHGRTVSLAASIPVLRPREGGPASEGFAVHETLEIEPAVRAIQSQARRSASPIVGERPAAVVEELDSDDPEDLEELAGITVSGRGDAEDEGGAAQRARLNPEQRARMRAARRRRHQRRTGTPSGS